MTATAFAWAFRNDLAALGEAQQAMAAWLEARGVPEAARSRLHLVLDELAANVIEHGHAVAERGRHPLRLALRLGAAAELVLLDRGAAFDPRGRGGTALEGPLEEARIGGLGLFLVEQLAQRIEYGRTPDGWNETRVTVALPDAPAAPG
ncbi:ATP-binding protein [Paracraurococcus ruber]|uniref:Histidine kinase/HSP90-like ATPase domain-containing protein n=1 Tax=Paracraurococcus ruber TaxID=77675 RepID=A0ABS1D2Q6_9PROT|nr:ATP-binding protein [Paracraurococcus ruber]MBK1661122.1 hypothetical protein [Paracraurococcus ruber]TDG22548.1 ATP-binding protein [Paracraurococcus ruber]